MKNDLYYVLEFYILEKETKGNRKVGARRLHIILKFQLVGKSLIKPSLKICF
jgi:hypothetical protein